LKKLAEQAVTLVVAGCLIAIFLAGTLRLVDWILP
jgi:hypothetical protein